MTRHDLTGAEPAIEPSGSGFHPPNGYPIWPDLADAIGRETKHALDDPSHLWAKRWPTSTEMAERFGVTQSTVLKALRHLGRQEVLVKARMPRTDAAKQELWVPTEWSARFTAWTTHRITEEILVRGLRGQWRVLPDRDTLTAQFGVSRRTISQITQRLQQHRLAVLVRINGRRRWLIVPPRVARRLDPQLSTPRHLVVVADLVRRIQQGEFRYRLPGGTVQERPFLARSELAGQYGASEPVIAKVRAELCRRNLIVPGAGPNVPYQLAEHVPPVDRATAPPPRPLARPPAQRNKRARELADDLIRRIRQGEFTARPFPGPVEVMRHYQAGQFNVRAAFDLLNHEGWVEFRQYTSRRIAIRSGSQPHQRTPRWSRRTTSTPDPELPQRTAQCTVTATILAVLAHHSGPMTLSELSLAGGLHPAAITPTVRRLVEHQWVRRVQDGRGWLYTLDSEGYGLVDENDIILSVARTAPSRSQP